MACLSRLSVPHVAAAHSTGETCVEGREAGSGVVGSDCGGVGECGADPVLVVRCGQSVAIKSGKVHFIVGMKKPWTIKIQGFLSCDSAIHAGWWSPEHSNLWHNLCTTSG
jgi:uncharacterized 2Fe-2S/4Fe-4S cluster protein (DUF4445 family)